MKKKHIGISVAWRSLNRMVGWQKISIINRLSRRCWCALIALRHDRVFRVAVAALRNAVVDAVRRAGTRHYFSMASMASEAVSMVHNRKAGENI